MREFIEGEIAKLLQAKDLLTAQLNQTAGAIGALTAVKARLDAEEAIGDLDLKKAMDLFENEEPVADAS